MNTLDHLNTIISQFQTHAITIGLTIAGLMIVVSTIFIMLHNDTSPTGRAQRWENLQKVIICAVIIAATGAFVSFATNIGHMF